MQHNQQQQQRESLNIINVDEVCIGAGLMEEEKRRRHSTLLPNSIRCLICGPSNCGKSNVMFSLLFDKNGLKFENVYVYSKSLNQPKYKLLSKMLHDIKEIGYFPYSENGEILHPNDARGNSVFIFDDVACDKQDKIREYFSMGRHNSIDSFYLSQSFAKIPKLLIRDNANFIILFKQDDLNLRHAYYDHVGTDMSYEKFKEICSDCWNEKYGFLTIDKDSGLNYGRYRRGMNNYIKVSEK